MKICTNKNTACNLKSSQINTKYNAHECMYIYDTSIECEHCIYNSSTGFCVSHDYKKNSTQVLKYDNLESFNSKLVGKNDEMKEFHYFYTKREANSFAKKIF